jgi:hypothetical protein
MSSDQCPVCFEALLEPPLLDPGQQSPLGAPTDRRLHAAIPCGHCIHDACLEEYLAHKRDNAKRCPSCSAKARFYRIYVSAPETWSPEWQERFEALRRARNDMKRRRDALGRRPPSGGPLTIKRIRREPIEAAAEGGAVPVVRGGGSAADADADAAMPAPELAASDGAGSGPEGALREALEAIDARAIGLTQRVQTLEGQVSRAALEHKYLTAQLANTKIACAGQLHQLGHKARQLRRLHQLDVQRKMQQEMQQQQQQQQRPWHQRAERHEPLVEVATRNVEQLSLVSRR